MKMKELIKKTPEELKKMLTQKQESLRQFRFSVAGAQIRNTKEGMNTRKDIARIKTILNNQEQH